MNKIDEAYVKSFKGWLRIQDNDKERYMKYIALTKEQVVLDDEVTRLAIIDFNAWAKENGTEAIEVPKYKGYTVGTSPTLGELHFLGDIGVELINFKGGETVVPIKDQQAMQFKTEV